MCSRNNFPRILNETRRTRLAARWLAVASRTIKVFEAFSDKLPRDASNLQNKRRVVFVTPIKIDAPSHHNATCPQQVENCSRPRTRPECKVNYPGNKVLL